MRAGIGRETFVASPIISESGHARSFEETLAWVTPLLRRVPITRVSDVTPLDVLGLPVWSAVTPLARDMTVHNGKGCNPIAARVSAIMEAIERSSADQFVPTESMRASYVQLLNASHTPTPVDPLKFNLPFDTQYRADGVFAWMPVFDLIHSREVLVPTDFVGTIPDDGICIGIETNGLASGNNYTEATVHALNEVIERYSASRHAFADALAESSDLLLEKVRMIDISTLPPDSAEWARQIEKHGLRLVVRDVTTELGVPVFKAIVIDPEYPSPSGPITEAFDGFGADIDATRAVMRAVTEAVQSRAAFIQGSSDTFEGGESVQRTFAQHRLMETYYPRQLFPFCQGPTRTSGNLLSDLDELVARLRGAGFEHCLVADLTRRDLGVPVVRVLVPEMIAYPDSSRAPGLSMLATFF